MLAIPSIVIVLNPPKRERLLWTFEFLVADFQRMKDHARGRLALSLDRNQVDFHRFLSLQYLTSGKVRFLKTAESSNITVFVSNSHLESNRMKRV
ncbi:MAG: hypothetical protein F4X44_07820 [Gammaproteobacteria bacterium]|nr:hypothetical protein [Gammaproteobacteria bacterium]MYD80504.1 hypothetical protein [Gammaproteobacteria bacterium]